MQMSLTLAVQVLVMFVLAGVGYVMFRAGKITLEGNRSIGNILIYLSLPAVIIKGFMVERTVESAVVARLLCGPDAIANFASTFSNPSFFGIPLVTSVIGATSVFYMTGFIAAMNIGQWTYGVSLLTGERAKVSPRDLIRAPFVIATLIGVILFATQLQLPHVLSASLDFVAALNTPLAMFTIGVYMAHVDVRKMLGRASLYRICVVRLAAIPLVSLAILSLLPAGYFNMKLALLIAQACPVGSNVAVYAQLHGGDYVYAVETIVVSVLLSVVSIPLVVGLAQLVW